ncbi:hypothetical protein K470DRAFT_221905 [Piedraia hortae CBS 480.64]|uniref:Uncharacterized protein n=1 Tax=Piedraia hortae CBS 480.64 TaxID=1314780 RepID=A0A6A7BSF5_9PEZI|nr:hypothetical protein K470DRAFT_221905 [Piedraia hortae CBS 480.64]
MPYKPSFTRRPASATVKTPPDTPTPRTSWFSRKPAPPPTVPRDEFINLDIDRALHHPNPTALAAFDDLMENATDLLRRMQKAYRIKAERLADMQPTMEAQREELAEANTRARYLEMRLKDAESRANEEARRADELCSKVEKLEAQICESEDSQSWGRRRETEASDSGFESDHDEKRTNDDTESHMTANSSQTLVLASRVALSPVHENMDDLRRKNLELTRRLEQMEQTFQGCIDFISATSRP